MPAPGLRPWPLCRYILSATHCFESECGAQEQHACLGWLSGWSGACPEPGGRAGNEAEPAPHTASLSPCPAPDRTDLSQFANWIAVFNWVRAGNGWGHDLDLRIGKPEQQGRHAPPCTPSPPTDPPPLLLPQNPDSCTVPPALPTFQNVTQAARGAQSLAYTRPCLLPSSRLRQKWLAAGGAPPTVWCRHHSKFVLFAPHQHIYPWPLWRLQACVWCSTTQPAMCCCLR